MTNNLVIANGTVVTPELGTFRADVGVDGDRIASLAAPGTLTGDSVVDASGNHVLPGAIDPHTHHGLFRDLAADAESESRAALAGGVTTIGNIYREGRPYAEILDDVFAACEPNYYHDYFLTLGLLSDVHTAEVPSLVTDRSITSFKWYGNYKLQAREKFGVDRNLLDDVADGFIQELADQDVQTTLAYHAENAEITERLTDKLQAAGATGYGAIVDRFPGYAEAQSAVAGSNLARQHDYDDSFYTVHVSAARTVDELESLREQGYGVTAETCTHYLTLTSEECDDRMKINPPVRSAADRERLWEALADGLISCVGTDHISNLEANKVGENIWETMWGSPSTPTMLPLILSEGVGEGRVSLERAVEVTSTETAKAWNLYPKKGTIRVGSDADLVVVDLDETRTVTPDLYGYPDYTMYTGREVTGWPTHTVVRGTVVYAEGVVVGEPGHGTHVDRPVPSTDDIKH